MAIPSSSAERRLSVLGRSARQADYDRYLIALFAPPDKREVLFALIAFNHELARIRESVTEPMLGQIRLQWWREAVTEALAGKPRRHDMLEALAAAHSALSEGKLEEMLEGREIELESEPPATLEHFREYAASTSGALAEAMAIALAGDDDGTGRAAARAVGTAYGMIGLLRSVPFHARRGRVLLPVNVLEASGTSVTAIRELHDEPGLSRAAERISAAAWEELAKARETRRTSRAVRPVLLLSAVTATYLRKLRSQGYKLFQADLSVGLLRRQIAVGWAAMMERG